MARRADGLTVLVVEDVQWADDATLDLLRYLGRRLRHLPVLMVVTFRDDALAPGDSLRVALGELTGQRWTRRIDLPPLSPAGVRHLAEGTTYSPEELHRLTGGNPFFLTEVLGCSCDEVPVSASDAVLARVARLDETARRLLEIASLDGYRVDADLVCAATGSTGGTLDELVSAGLLTADGEDLRFRHELSRLAVESAIPPHRCVAGHRALIAALLARECDDEDARLAFHAEEAGDAALVARFAPRAAAQAAEMGAYREAAAQYERALRFPTDDLAVLAELHDGYADQLAMLDSWPRAAAAREQARDLEMLGDSRREAYASRDWRPSTGASAEGPSRQPRSSGPWSCWSRGADPELARTLATHAFDVWARDADAGRETLRRAVAMADQIGDPAVRSDVLNNAAFGAFIERADWVPMARDCLRLALEAGAEAQAGAPTPTSTPGSASSTGSPRASATGATASPTATSAT